VAELDPGKAEVRLLLRGKLDYISLSPNRRLLACVVQKKNLAPVLGAPEWFYSVALLDIAARQLKSAGPEPGIFDRDVCPVWSRDGKKLAWVRNDLKKCTCSLLVHDFGRKRTRTLRLLGDEGADAGSLVWAPDANHLVCVTRDNQRTRYSLGVVFLAVGTTRDVLSAKDQLRALAWE
jgi:hypothetical protein